MSRQCQGRMSRRTFVKGLGAVLGGGATVYAGRYLVPPSPRFESRTSSRTLEYVAPHSGEEIQFINKTDEPSFLPPVAYTWSLDGRMTSTNRDYSCSLSETRTTGVAHTVHLTASRGFLSGSTERRIEADPENLPEYQEKRMSIPIKGVNYHIGRRFMGDYGKTPDQYEINESLEVIRRELGCNAIKIYGDNQDVMVSCAKKAIEKDFHTIVLSLRHKFKAPEQEVTIDEHAQTVVEFSKKAEEILKIHDDTVLCVGEELQYSVRGLVDAPSYDERIDAYHKMMPEQRVDVDKNLNRYLSEIMKGVKQNFSGRVTYSSNEMTTPAIDWESFDIVGPMFYSTNVGALEELKAYGKPVYVTEFGSQCFIGAANGDEYHGQEYSQEEQARFVERIVPEFGRIGIDGVFYWTFIAKIDESDAESFGLIRWNRTGASTRKAGFYSYKNLVVR